MLLAVVLIDCLNSQLHQYQPYQLNMVCFLFIDIIIDVCARLDIHLTKVLVGLLSFAPTPISFSLNGFIFNLQLIAFWMSNRC